MKINLLKKLLCLSPVVISPILVTACGNSDGGDKIDALKLKTATLIQDPNKVVAPGKFYLDFYQRELDAIWATKTAAINAAATNVAANHQYDLQLRVLSEVLTKVKTDGAAEFKKEFPKLDDYNADIFDDITVSFTIPDDSKGNLKIDNDNKLTIYPASILSGATSEKHINYTLKLTSSQVSAKDLSGSLKFDLNAGFIDYNTGSADGKKLTSNIVQGVYGNANLSEILVAENGGGLDVGAKQADGTYNFTNYKTGQGLAFDNAFSVYGSTDMSTILVGTEGGGLSVGTRAKASDSYTFKNYTTSSSGKEKLASDSIYGVFGNTDMSKILVGTYEAGIDLGTRQPDGSYNFTNYNSSSGLAGDKVTKVYGTADLSTILVTGQALGLDVGTKQSDDSYTFDKYNSGDGLANDDAFGLYGNADLSTILVGTLGAGLSVGTKQADKSYQFTTYNSSNGLTNNIVLSAYGSADMSTILVGGAGGGLDVGTKQPDGKYTFANYKIAQGLTSDDVYSVYGNADLSTILVGQPGGGLDISSKLVICLVVI